MAEIRYSIKIASARSGVSAHLIRMWEKRYGALSPHRTETNRRLYSSENVERLSLLHTCTQSGHRIGNIATLPTETLRQLAQEAAPATDPAPPHQTGRNSREPSLPGNVKTAIRAIENLDADALHQALDQAALKQGNQGMLTKVVMPLMQHIGRLWCAGDLTAAHEHFASSALRTYLLGQVQSYTSSRNAPVLITVTPTGQLHELGAVVCAAAANASGWHVIHLGPSLPAAEIAGAAIRTKANMVALSLVHPADDPGLPAQLRMLRRLLPRHIAIVVGGAATAGYRQTLQEIQARVATDMIEFQELLQATRQEGPKE
jgi:methanogenic corrinoid protein MtbC1